MGAIKIGKVVLSSLFKKSECKMYPVAPIKVFENTRGHVVIEENSCIACGICQRKCPVNAITVDKKERTWSIERMQCIMCGHCVTECPKKCLTMANDYTTPDTQKITDTFKLPPAPAKKAAAGADGKPKKKFTPEEIEAMKKAAAEKRAAKKAAEEAAAKE